MRWGRFHVRAGKCGASSGDENDHRENYRGGGVAHGWNWIVLCHCLARSYNLSEATVKVHLKAILRKIKAHNRTQAAILAIQHGY
jgi:hypothetical protein